MTRLLIVRHGQSMANVQEIFAGHYDVPLSPLGQEQAERTAAYVTAHYAIDRIYSSDLIRTMETAGHVAKKLHLSVTLVPELREIFAGAWEGKRFDRLATEYKEDYGKWLSDIGESACTGGESVMDVSARVVGALKRIAAENDGKTVFVATHALPVRVFQCFVQGVPACDMKNVPWVSNASVTEATFENGKFTLVSVGADAHLAELKTGLPTNG